MIFTRRFGALRARPTFPHYEVLDREEYQARLAAERQARTKAATDDASARRPRWRRHATAFRPRKVT
jgi:hypothetical protein